MTGQRRAVQERRGGDGIGAYRRRLFIPCGAGFRQTHSGNEVFSALNRKGGASRPSGVETGKDRVGAETEGNALTAWKRTCWEFGGGAVFSASAPQRAVVDGRIIFG